MGLGPSFALFALTHNFLVIGLCEQVGIDFSESFRILGDDIVITDDSLAKLYKDTLARLECPISESKTLSSYRLGEFAGNLVMKDKTFPSFKFRSMSDRNFLDVAKNLGPKSIGLLRPRQRKVMEFFSCVPEEFGGLGWNPLGLPLSQRIPDFIFEKDGTRRTPVRSRSDFEEYLVQQNLVDPTVVDQTMALQLAGRDPSQVKSSIFRTLNIKEEIMLETELGPNLKDWELGSTQTSDPRGPSLLDRLERDILDKNGRGVDIHPSGDRKPRLTPSPEIQRSGFQR
jgi:hypothetical protein